MNSVQRLVIDVLRQGAQPATNVLGAMALRGWKNPIEELYVVLVAMEAASLVRVEGIYDGAGNRLGGAWALGRKTPELEPARTSFADMVAIFGRPTGEDEAAHPGTTIHRCL